MNRIAHTFRPTIILMDNDDLSAAKIFHQAFQVHATKLGMGRRVISGT